MSMVSRPSAPGAAPPASSQARARAAARAVRMAFSARGASLARRPTSRETTGSEATGPNSPGSARSIATSARQSPPSASATTRSATIFPGPCTARAGRHRSSAASRPQSRPVTRSTRVSSRPPAWEMIPVPSADTMILRLPAVRCTRKVPFELVRTGLSPSPILPVQRHFSYLKDQAGTAARRKPEANLDLS